MPDEPKICVLTADDQCLLFISLLHQKPRGYWNNIDPAGDSLLLVLETVFNFLSNISYLIFCRSVLAEACLFWCKEVTIFQVPNQSGVDHLLHKFTNAACQAYGSVALCTMLIFPFFVYGDHDGFSPYLWNVTGGKTIVVYGQ